MTQPQSNSKSPIRETNDEARDLGRSLLAEALFGALATLEPETGFPLVSRIAFALDDGGRPISLMSTLASHTRALLENPQCSVLLGESGKGDPLAHPRISLQTTAQKILHQTDEHRSLRKAYLQQHPKSALYVDFGDFFFFRFDIQKAYLNGGFGKAFILNASDLQTSEMR
ncbi:MAG: pyridoxamine 5'-phosphate oxidase family protein [Hyphomicrobiales bacterium]